MNMLDNHIVFRCIFYRIDIFHRVAWISSVLETKRRADHIYHVARSTWSDVIGFMRYQSPGISSPESP